MVTTFVTEDREEALDRADAFLRSDPVRHNLLLTLVTTRNNPCTFVSLEDAGAVVGFARLDPDHERVVVSTMDPGIAATLAPILAPLTVGIDISGPLLPTSELAHAWTEYAGTSAQPVLGERLYELLDPQPIPDTAGAFRIATAHDAERLVTLARDFDADLGSPARSEERIRLFTEQYVADERVFVWEHEGNIVSMAAHTESVAGVVRVQSVYTPAEYRGRGYAAACVGTLSRQLHGANVRVVLYTDLGNATSNALYRRLGYRAVEDGIVFRVGAPRAL